MAKWVPTNPRSKTKVRIATGANVLNKCLQGQGEISIEEGAVILPKAAIVALFGNPIRIGVNAFISERCELRGRIWIGNGAQVLRRSKIIGHIHISTGPIISENCELRGKVTIGPGTKIETGARIIGEPAPIFIGKNNVIEKEVQILNLSHKNICTDTDYTNTMMIIGDDNIFEAGAYIEALRIGDNNLFESECKISRLTHLTNGCIVEAGCELTSDKVIPENPVIYGPLCERKLREEFEPFGMSIKQESHMNNENNIKTECISNINIKKEPED